MYIYIIYVYLVQNAFGVKIPIQEDVDVEGLWCWTFCHTRPLICTLWFRTLANFSVTMSGSKRVCCPQKCVQHLLKTCCQMDKTMQEKLGQVHVIQCFFFSSFLQVVGLSGAFFLQVLRFLQPSCLERMYANTGSRFCTAVGGSAFKDLKCERSVRASCCFFFSLKKSSPLASAWDHLHMQIRILVTLWILVALCVKFGIFLLASKVEVVVLRQLVCNFPSFLTVVFYWISLRTCIRCKSFFLLNIWVRLLICRYANCTTAPPAMSSLYY